MTSLETTLDNPTPLYATLLTLILFQDAHKGNCIQILQTTNQIASAVRHCDLILIGLALEKLLVHLEIGSVLFGLLNDGTLRLIMKFHHCNQSCKKGFIVHHPEAIDPGIRLRITEIALGIFHLLHVFFSIQVVIFLKISP